MISRFALLHRLCRPSPTGTGPAAPYEGARALGPIVLGLTAALATALAVLSAPPLSAQEATARFGTAQGTPFAVYSTTDIAILRPALEAKVNPDSG